MTEAPTPIQLQIHRLLMALRDTYDDEGVLTYLTGLADKAEALAGGPARYFPPADTNGAVGHPTFTHTDGRGCVWTGGAWFVPLDAGGEGFDCDRAHAPDPNGALA